MNHETATAQTEPHHPSAKVLVPALLVGWAIVGFGVHSALRNARESHPFALLVHVVTFDLGHDLIVAPVAFLVFWLAGRFLPERARGPVRAAIATSVLFSVFSVPLIHRWGKRPTNSSTLPLAYGRNLAIILALIWGLAAVTVAIRTIRGTPQPLQTDSVEQPSN
jgi:hypothetical protein